MMQQEFLEEFKGKFNQYFDLFLLEYPNCAKHVKARCEAEEGTVVTQVAGELMYGEHPIYSLAIECQAMSMCLPQNMLFRLNQLGLSEVLPFDNVVDWYSWYETQRVNNESPDKYTTIFFRLNSEIERIILACSYSDFDRYAEHNCGSFIVSGIQESAEKDAMESGSDNDNSESPDNRQHNYHFTETTNNNYYTDARHSLEMQSTVLSNGTNIVANVLKLLGMKI
ncbi:hypothetical protein ACOQ0N_004779 [Vibrio parahaemolyticus]|uniref:hypothetical protein n=1 Tax=Vibrio furnissii TaxID=29494 RepID=UPI001559266A|nr:hypothetical protein [Vibrio furnissii]